MFTWKLSYQEIRWPVSRDHIAGSDRAHQGCVLFSSWSLTKFWFSIGSRAQVRLTCWKQGRIVRKPVNANPGLKVNQIITFFPSLYKCFFFCCFVLCIEMLLTGWEVRIGKNFDRGPENAARGRRPRAAFSSPRSQFYLYGPTLSRPITFFLSILAVNSLTSGLRAVYNSNHSPKNLTSERTSKSDTIRGKMN